jgi:chromate reductase
MKHCGENKNKDQNELKTKATAGTESSRRNHSHRAHARQRPLLPRPDNQRFNRIGEKVQMDKILDVAVIVGSLRKSSLNRQVANSLAALAPATLKLSIINIGHFPIYDQDGDEEPPASWKEFCDRIEAADAVLFVTPEHNRSVSAALKNALDVGSRPYGKNVWSGKPGAVVSASPGGIGGFGANHHLRQSLVFLNVPAMAQTEAYIGGANKLFDATGKLTCKFCKAIQAYTAWITANTRS